MKKSQLFLSLVTLLAMFMTTVPVKAEPISAGAFRGSADPVSRFDMTKLPGLDDVRGGNPELKPGKENKNYTGTIAAVDAGSLTLTIKGGSSVVFLLNADTKIKIAGLGRNATAADLKIGDSATVRASQNDTGGLVAASIEVKPAKEDKPAKPLLAHFAGTVTEYQAGASITIQDKKGASSTFMITADTKIKFDPKDSGNTLAVGSEVTIVALRDPAGGTPTAEEIAVQKTKPAKPVNYGGTIAAVDAGSLTLTLKDGSSVAFILNADTQVKISGLGHGATFADLAVGDTATVRATKDDSGALVANQVEVKPVKAKLEHFAGTVTDYQAGVRITIQDKKGASSTFLIDADTKIMFGPKDEGNTLAIGSEVTIVALRDPANTTPVAREIAVHSQKKNFHGAIAAVDAGSLTLTLKDGSSLAFILTADTKVKIPTLGRNATVLDLFVGENVEIRALKDDAGAWVAQEIMVIPGKPVDVHRVGTVTDYQPGISITIQDKDGGLFTFVLTASTKILPAERADQLAVGSRVTIIAPRDVAGGTLTAKGIVVHPAGEGESATPTVTATTMDTPTVEPTATETETATVTLTDTPITEPTATETETATPTP